MDKTALQEQIIAAIEADFKDKLDTNWHKIVKAAEETFRNNDDQAAPVIKLGYTVAVDMADTKSPTINTKIAWTTRYADAAEITVDDPDQPKLPFAGANVEVRVLNGDHDRVKTKKQAAA